MTALSIVTWGPVNQFLADTLHQTASTASAPKVRSGT